MAISDSAKVDLLYKKYFGVTKTDLPANKSPSNESIASPALLRGDIVWQQATSIPPTAAAVAGVVQAYQTTGRIECTADTTSTPISSVYPSWKTNLTDWIPPEFGATYFVKVYAETTGNANPTTGTPLSDSGIAGVGEWNFDYSAGVLNFIGGTIPAALTAAKVIYVTGYRYIGTKGVTNYPGGMTIGNITIAGNTITGNTGVSFGGNIYGDIYGNIVSSGTSQLGNLSFTNGTISSVLTNGNITLDPNGTGNVSVSGAVITNLGSPTGNTDAVTKSYVDSALNALSSSNINQQNSSVSVVDTGSNGNIIVNVDGSNIAYFSQTSFTVSNITLANNSIVSQSNVVNFPGTGAITLPSGDSTNRPTGVTGEIRYNTDLGTPEYYDGLTWVPVSNTVTDQSFSGDGSNVTYTLDQDANEAGILVSINGTLQQPGVAYTVAGDQITFAEIPLVTDVIDIRFLGGLVSVTGTLYDDLTVSGNITSGNIIPGANVTYSLGSATNQWKDLWVSNNTIYIGNTPITVSGGSLLTNGAAISGTYSNTNVAAYLPSNGTITGIQANLGAYQTYANSNAATQATSINSISANLGAYQIYANANSATQATAITSLATSANANTAAYLANGISTNISTSGNVTASGISPFYAPNRPAFRITGNGGSISATTTVSGGYMVVDYNQGSYLNTTTGLFTAPVSGLYQVNIVVRTNSNTNGTINQIIIRKTAINGGAVTAQIMVEFGTNTSMNHAGGSTIVKMEAGDTLKFDVAVGTISFDANDNWSVAYIG
jgi:hypothetical protein